MGEIALQNFACGMHFGSGGGKTEIDPQRATGRSDGAGIGMTARPETAMTDRQETGRTARPPEMNPEEVGETEARPGKTQAVVSECMLKQSLSERETVFPSGRNKSSGLWKLSKLFSPLGSPFQH